MNLERANLVSGFIAGLKLPDTTPSAPNAIGLNVNRRIAQRRSNGSLRSAPLAPHPVGQYERTSAGSLTWTVPQGVRQISAICVGGGGRGGSGNSSYRYYGGGGGGGGASAYATFAVTPGERLTVSVGGINGTSFVRRQNGSTLVSAGGGSNGTSSNRNSVPGGSGGRVLTGLGQNGTNGAGGKTGSESNDGGNGGIPGSISGLGRGYIKHGSSQYGTGGGGGIGGRVSRHRSAGSGVARGGALRLIWGDGRSYPSTNVQDM